MPNKKTIFFIITAMLYFPLSIKGQAVEHNVKAAFLERFTRFVEWPDETGMQDSTKPFVLCVIGENTFGNALEVIFSNQKIKNRKVKLKYISNINELNGINLLFISESEKNSLPKILSYVNNKPILTVSDSPGFAEKGVGINLITENNKIKFEINVKTLNDKGIKPSSQLLSYASAIYRK